MAVLLFCYISSVGEASLYAFIPSHFFFNKQLDFGPALKSCLTYLGFQPPQNAWYPLKPLILALFWLLNVTDKFARMYSIKKAISPEILAKSQPWLLIEQLLIKKKSVLPADKPNETRLLLTTQQQLPP